MKKVTKTWLVIASILVVLGLLVFAGAMSAYDWDFKSLSTEKYETNDFNISEEFNNISIATATADIQFVLLENGECRVECYEEEKANHSVTVMDDTLVIKLINDKAWHDYIGINFESPRITVYLPKAEYASLLIEESTGDIQIPKGFKFENVDVSVSTGDINIFGVNCKENIKVGVSTGKVSLSDTTCQNLISKGSTGDIVLKNVIAAEKLSIERSTGDVKFENSDAAEIFIETNTGDIVGTLLSEKIFYAKTDTGSIDVPKGTLGGKCDITTDTGDIKIKIQSS